MRSFLLLGIFLAPIWVAQAQQSPKAAQAPVVTGATAVPIALKADPDPQDYPQLVMPIPTWVEAAPGCKVFISDYTEGMTVKWQGDSKDGKGHGTGQLTRYDNAGNLMSIAKGTLQQGLWQGLMHIDLGDATMDAHMQDGYMEGQVQMNDVTGLSFQGQMAANIICGQGRRVHPDGTTEEGFFLDGELLRGQVKNTKGQAAYVENGQEVDALSPEKAYTPALGVQLVEYLDKNGRLCNRAEAQYYRVVTYKAPFRPQGLVRDYYIDGTLQAEFNAPYLDPRYPPHMYYDGLRKEYDKNGLLTKEYWYAFGGRRGMSTAYWPNSMKRWQVVYSRKGTMHGPSRLWSESGYLLTFAHYDEGTLVGGRILEYDEAGRRTLAHLVDFQQDVDNWERQDGDGFSDADNYAMTITPNQGATALRYAPVRLVMSSYPEQEEDYAVTVRMHPMQAGRYGLLLGAKDAYNYTSFELDGTGKARVCRTKNGRTKELKPWTAFPAAASGQDFYYLKVVCQQGQWYFFCQGQELFSLPAEKLKAYNFGFLTQVELDAYNLELRESMGSEEPLRMSFPVASPLQPMPWVKWVQAGPDCKVLEPCFRPGMTLKWEGPVQQGKAHGQGRLTCYVDGRQEYLFEGSCQQGIATGKGKRTDADGCVWEGDFADGLPHGQQHVVWPNGREYYGQAFSGRMHGEGKLLYPDGTVEQGFIANGHLHTGQVTTPKGKRTYYYQSEEVEELPAQDKHKPYTPALGVPVVEYNDIYSVRCDKDKAVGYQVVTYKAPFIPQGKVLSYYMDGTLSSEHQALYLDEDGTRALLHGELKTYYKNGPLHDLLFFDRGKSHGKQITYAEDGKIEEEAHWQQGKEHGIQRIWDEDGESLIIYASYVNGVETDRWHLSYENGLERCRSYSCWQISEWSRLGEVSMDEQQEFQQVSLQGQAGKLSWLLRDIPILQQHPYTISGTMGLKELREGVSYGLLLGYLDADNHCELLVRHQGQGGEVAFFCTRNGVRRMLMPWKQVSLQAQSRLALSRKADHMEVCIDGGTPIVLPLTLLAGHKFGACLYGNDVLQIDRFETRELVTEQEEQ